MKRAEKYIWWNSLTEKEQTALQCIHITQRLIIRNGPDTNYNQALHKVIDNVSKTFNVNVADTFKIPIEEVIYKYESSSCFN